MSSVTPALEDAVLLRFLKAHGLLRRIASGRAFVAAVGAPAAARRRREAPNVIRLGGYYRLAVRRRADGALEVGVLHGRRPDLADAEFEDASARALVGATDVQAACRSLALRTEPPVAAPAAPPPGPCRPAGRLRSAARLTFRCD